MKPILVIGLGNGLVGDDGVGCTMIERLARVRSLRRRADLVAGGCDLLRLADLMAGRRKVIIIDVVLSDAPPGTVSVYEEPFDGLDAVWTHAHHPSLVQSVALLKTATPALRRTPFTLVAVAVAELHHQTLLAERLPEIADAVRDALERVTPRTKAINKFAGTARR